MYKNRFSIGKSLQRLIFVLAAVSALAFLTSAFAGPAEAMDAKALTKLDDDWSKLAAKRDLDGMVSFYAEDAVVYAPNEPVAKGCEAAKKVWSPLLADASASISWKTNHAEVSKSGDIGVTAGTYEISSKGPDGKPKTEKGKYLCIWKPQKDGIWKVTHDMWNSDAK